ncbi:cell division protein FtsX [Neoasaia chiangmaiensis NBRC 101099]|uniref:Cell division protein FtsX n=1 Tax=Neoasaia chiangmaiensis TaxID=320497 RepID=A0A1U9KN12_9PROT|nr:hypothetical protein [Neoasaia chiangmaiensis]AQS87191.1 hypothetical protein A0U93_03705 [Neoasaia chiangmaiensis]GBR38296.1 cell division protein FtsX [Neoasaia chiangmaiensis NBRC 101099]GEN15960.1 hypothetical protein NCH01_23910 [Neoasaia chiangmaiensis]
MSDRRHAAKGGIGLNLGAGRRTVMAVIAAMSAIAALALGGWTAARALSAQWRQAALHTVTIEIPTDDTTASSTIDALVTRLKDIPGVADARHVPVADVRSLLAPWLGTDMGTALALPAVVTLTRRPTLSPEALQQVVRSAIPEAVMEENLAWGERLDRLGASLQACALITALLATIAAACVVGLSVRTILATRRQPVTILHSLGAGDGLIAGRIARHVGGTALIGGIVGIVIAWPMLGLLAHLTLPFQDATATPQKWSAVLLDWRQIDWRLPRLLAWSLGILPCVTALIGWGIAQINVRLWLRRFP